MDVGDELDNCPGDYSPNQLDFNDDAIRDVCDGISLTKGETGMRLIKTTSILGQEIQTNGSNYKSRVMDPFKKKYHKIGGAVFPGTLKSLSLYNSTPC